MSHELRTPSTAHDPRQLMADNRDVNLSLDR